MSCARPRVTPRVVNPGTGARAWCTGCQAWQPARQVSWQRMARARGTGRITGTYAPVAH